MTAPSDKNKSELLFEGYLRSEGHHDFEFEPQIAGTSKRPDYRLHWKGQAVLYEVKQFRAEASDLKGGFRSFNPYLQVREKIDAARKKFQRLKDHCCCLVLYNRDKPLVLLAWKFVYRAMLGDLAWSVPLDLPGRARAENREVTTIFTSGGKMHREHDKAPVAPQNQTISAILVLGRVPIGERLFHVHLRQREGHEGRSLTVNELFTEIEGAQGTIRDLSWKRLRVVVHENPYARIPLPPDLFRGPYDERYGDLDGRIQLLYRGAELAALPGEDE